jgi:hypothetical protein
LKILHPFKEKIRTLEKERKEKGKEGEKRAALAPALKKGVPLPHRSFR